MHVKWEGKKVVINFNKKRRKIALILVFSLMLCNSISAEDLLHYFDTSRIEESAEKNSNIDFSNLFNNIITGNFDEVKSDIIDNVKELFLENLQKNISNIKLLCVICLLIGLFKNAVNGIEEKGIYEIVSFIGQILILSIAIIAFKEMIGILKEVAVSIIDIIDSAIPLMIGVISLNGNTVHAAGVYAILMFVTERLLYIIDGIIIPLISTGTLIRIVNLLSKKEMLSKMSDLFSFITNGLIKIGAFAFVALLTFEKIGGGTVGSFFGNSTKSVIKMIPVVGDIYGNGIDIASSALKTLNSGISLSIIIILITASIIPIIKILTITFLYKIVAALIEPVSDKETVEIIDSIGEGGKQILSTLFSVLFMFIMTNVICMNFMGG